METQTMKWYIVKSQSNREKSVLEKLKKEAERGDMTNKIGRILVPVEKTFFLKNGKRVYKEKIMYPGYVFVETNAVDELDHFVKACDGATGILSDRSKQPQVIQDKEVEKMLHHHKEVNEQVESNSKYLPGEEIKILDGPFATFNGTIEDIDNKKVKVSVMIFGRKTIVELGILQIDKIYI